MKKKVSEVLKSKELENDAIKTFMEENRGSLHIKLLTHYQMYANKDEQAIQLDTDILRFEMPFGVYNISYSDLKAKCKDECDYMLANKSEFPEFFKEE